MKKLFILSFALLSFALVNAQDEADKKIIETSFEVKGVCDMCKTRIENAAMRTNGVKLAEWDKETQQLKVVYKNGKTTEAEIHQSVADYGHETSQIPADSSAYTKLPDCCRYKDGAKCGH
ncbi:MAG: ATPase [Vicingaceae bacterium]